MLLGARDPSYDLVFCGPGNPAVLGTPPPPDIEYLPPRPQRELIDLYHAADLFVLPTGVREGFPLVIQEALACGLRVITCYDAGYDPYRALPGLSFRDRNPEAVRQAIHAVLASAPALSGENPKLREFCPPLDAWLKRLYSGTVSNERGSSPSGQRTGPSPASGPSSTPSSSTIAFANPAGMSIGGVTTWSLAMVRRLQSAGRPAVLLNHPRPDVPEVDRSAFADLPVVACHSILKAGRAGRNAELYRGVLPATIIPNWSAETYGICARLSRTSARQMRVIGFCHAHETWYFRLLRYYEPLIHRFVAVSEECGQVLRAQMPSREKDIVVCPYPVAAPKELSRAYAPAGSPLRLLYAGRIAQLQKRVNDLPRLARALAARGVNFALRIVGDGPDKAGLCARVRALDGAVRSRVTVEAGVAPARMPAILEDSDVCVLVSEYEGTSIFMLEGMTHGCVPVVTKVSGTAGVIDEGVNGFTRPVGDLEGLADVVSRLDRDRELLNAAGTRAALTAQRYSFDTYMNWFLGLVNAAWEDEPRSWPAGRPFLPGVEAALRRLVTTFPPVTKVVRWLSEQMRRS